jgi:hypothetical protein
MYCETQRFHADAETLAKDGAHSQEGKQMNWTDWGIAYALVVMLGLAFLSRLFAINHKRERKMVNRVDRFKIRVDQRGAK